MPSQNQILRHLARTHEIAVEAVRDGHHPFGALLVAADNETVLLEQANIDTVNHAESTLLRRAYKEFGEVFLQDCSLYTNVEPCCMCAGTLYWANVGCLVYGISERQLLAATRDHSENPTLNIPCRYVFEHGQKNIKVIGPVPQLEAIILQLQRDFWQR